MGQYYKIVNLDKKEFLKPHDFSEGAKLMEFGVSGCGIMAGLAVLLAEGNGRGGGDLRSKNPVIGSWAGDRIVIAGDYADEGIHGVIGSIYGATDTEGWKNVSLEVLKALAEDTYVKRELLQQNLSDSTLEYILPPDEYKALVVTRRPEKHVG